MPKLSKNDAKTMPKRRQNYAKMMPTRCQNYAKMMPKWCQHDAKIMPKRCQNEANTMPKRCQNDANTILKLYQNDAKMMPKRSQNDAKTLFFRCLLRKNTPREGESNRVPPGSDPPTSRGPNHYANPALEPRLLSGFLCTGNTGPGRAVRVNCRPSRKTRFFIFSTPKIIL